jgi:signal transduction histidine kinase
MDRRVDPRQWFSGLSLRAKVTLGMILPMILVLALFTVIEYQNHKTFMLTNLSLLASHSGRVVESNLRQAMLSSDFVELQKLLDSIGKTEAFRVVYLLDTSGRVIFSPQKKDVGLHLDNHQPDCQPCHHLPPSERPGSVVVKASDGEQVFRSMQVIENSSECTRCHDPDKRIIGLLLTDIPIAPLEAPLNAHTIEDLLWWTGTILVVVLVVNFVMGRFVLRRLEKLAQEISGYGQGQIPTPPVDASMDEIGQLASTFHAMTRQVEARNAENSALSESLQRQSSQRGELLKKLITIQEDERKRVARELHDRFGQSLTGLSFKVVNARQKLLSYPDIALNELTQTEEMIGDTAKQMYDMILTLRPSVLDDMGLAAALLAHTKRTLDGTGISFDYDDEGLSKRLPPEMETTLYRVFQEALLNIVRYSKATRVQIKLACTAGSFEGEVSDNGQGFDLNSVHLDGSKPRGLGLMGMQERLGLIGGRLEIHTEPGCGTTLRIHIPLEEEQDG